MLKETELGRDVATRSMGLKKGAPWWVSAGHLEGVKEGCLSRWTSSLQSMRDYFEWLELQHERTEKENQL